MKRFYYLSFYLFLFLYNCYTATAQSCTVGCSVSVVAPSAASMTATINNQTLCISGTGTYTGTISDGGKSNITICIASGVTLTTSIAMTANVGTVINNYGTYNQTGITIVPGVTFNNYGTTSMSGAVTVVGTLNNEAGATFTVTGGSFVQQSYNGGPSIVNNSGTLNIGTAASPQAFTMQASPGTTFNNNASGVVNHFGTFTTNGAAGVNNTYFTNNGTFTSTCNAGGPTTIGGSFVNNGTFSLPGTCTSTLSGPNSVFTNFGNFGTNNVFTVNSGTGYTSEPGSTNNLGGLDVTSGTVNVGQLINVTGNVLVTSPAIIQGDGGTCPAIDDYCNFWRYYSGWNRPYFK